MTLPHRTTDRRRRSVLLGFGLGVACGVLTALRGAANARRLTLTRHTVVIPELPAPFAGFRILHLTDLHLRRGSDAATRLLACIDAEQPDLLCLTGDYLFTALSGGEARAFFQAIAGYPVLATLGNADYREGVTAEERAAWMRHVPFLINAAASISRGGAQLWFAGVDDPHLRRDDLAAALRDVPADAPVILLAHSPDIVRQPLDPRIRLIMSGHTHGGQICLPGGIALYDNIRADRQYASGRHQVGRATLYVSRGIGATRIPARFGCLPEVTVFTLMPRGEGEGRG